MKLWQEEKVEDRIAKRALLQLHKLTMEANSLPDKYQ